MSTENETLELSEEVSRYILGAGDNSGLAIIRSIPELSAHARGNSLTLEGSVDKMVRETIDAFDTYQKRDRSR